MNCLSQICIFQFTGQKAVSYTHLLDTYDPGYPVTFVISFIAALITSNIALKMKTQARELAKLAYRTKIILDTNQLLQNGKTVEEIGNTMAAQLGKVLSHTVVYYGCLLYTSRCV